MKTGNSQSKYCINGPKLTHVVRSMTVSLFSSLKRAHAQAMNEYRGGKMSTEVVVDGNL